MSIETKLAAEVIWPSPQELVDVVVRVLISDPVDLLSTGAGPGEQRFLEKLSPQYFRTLTELQQTFSERLPRRPAEVRVWEIGSFLGVVCFALRKVGFQVTAQDIPEFQNNPRLQDRYRQAGHRMCRRQPEAPPVCVPGRAF